MEILGEINLFIFASGFNIAEFLKYHMVFDSDSNNNDTNNHNNVPLLKSRQKRSKASGCTDIVG